MGYVDQYFNPSFLFAKTAKFAVAINKIVDQNTCNSRSTRLKQSQHYSVRKARNPESVIKA